MIYEMRVAKFNQGAVVRIAEDGNEQRLALCKNPQQAECIVKILNQYEEKLKIANA